MIGLASWSRHLFDPETRGLTISQLRRAKFDHVAVGEARPADILVVDPSCIGVGLIFN
jgi:hypothetical protein